MLTKNEIESDVLNIISLELSIPEEKINNKERLSEDLGIDSIALVAIAMECEDRFGFEIPDDDLQTFFIVQDVIQYVCSKLAID